MIREGSLGADGDAARRKVARHVELAEADEQFEVLSAHGVSWLFRQIALTPRVMATSSLA